MLPYVLDVEKRSNKYRDFLSLGGKVALREEEMTDFARLAALDVPKLIMFLRMAMMSNGPSSATARQAGGIANRDGTEPFAAAPG